MVKILDNTRKIPETYQFIAILWFSFLLAIIPTGIFFAVMDPSVIGACLAAPDIGPLTVYSVGFLFFWLLCACSGILCVYFLSGNTTPDG